MPLEVRISASLRKLIHDYDPLKGLHMDVESGLTVAQVLDKIGIPAEKVKIIMVNGVASSLDRRLTNNDRLGLFPPVGGG